MPHACASHYIKDMQGQGQGYCSNKRGRGELFPTTASGRRKMHISSPLSSFIHYFLYLMTSPRSSSATVRYLDSRLIDAIGYNEGEIYACSYLHLISSKWDKKMMCFGEVCRERFVKKWQVTNLFVPARRRDLEGLLRLYDKYFSLEHFIISHTGTS